MQKESLREQKESLRDTIWTRVEPSLESYGDLVDSCLERMTLEQVRELQREVFPDDDDDDDED